MVDYGAILLKVVENVARLIPRRTVNEWEMGIRLFRGKIGRYEHKYNPKLGIIPWWEKCPEYTDLGVGVYWYVPFLGSMQIKNIKQDVKDSSRQDLTTEDGVSVSLQTTIEFGIGSLTQLRLKLREEEATDKVLNSVEAATASEVNSFKFDDLRKQQVREKGHQYSQLEKTLLDTTRGELKTCGIEIQSIRITQFTSSRTYRIISNNDGSTE